MTGPTEICIWCPDHPEMPEDQFNQHVNRMHPQVSDPRHSMSCWSLAEVTTPDGIIRSIACGRGRHRWGRHRNDHVRWSCPPRCFCVRHTARSRSDIQFWLHRRTDTAACWLSNHGHHRLAGWLWRTFRML